MKFNPIILKYNKTSKSITVNRAKSLKRTSIEKQDRKNWTNKVKLIVIGIF